MRNSIYPRPHDRQTVYLKDVVTGPNIEVGDCTIYNDFVHDPRDFEKNFNDAAIKKPEALRRWDRDYERIKYSIPAIHSGDLAALEEVE